MAERNKIATISDVEGKPRAALFTFANKTTRLVDADAYNQEVRDFLVQRGMSESLRNAYAGSKSVAEAIERFDALAGAFAEGKTGKAREAVPGGMLAEAVRRYLASPARGDARRDVTVESAAAFVGNLSDDQKKELRTRPEVITILGEIEAERAKARADAAPKPTTSLDDMLAAVGKPEPEPSQPESPTTDAPTTDQQPTE